MPQSPDWDEAYLAARAEDEDPGDLEEYEDPDSAPPAGLDDAELTTLIAEQLENGYVRWTTPSGRQYTTEPTRYPI